LCQQHRAETEGDQGTHRKLTFQQDELNLFDPLLLEINYVVVSQLGDNQLLRKKRMARYAPPLFDSQTSQVVIVFGKLGGSVKDCICVPVHR
jgi:hypothetical protein